MGNICSTTQKDGKDPESEVSEGGDNGCLEPENKPQTPDEEKEKHDTHTHSGHAAVANKAHNNATESNATVPPAECAAETEAKNSLSAYSKICGSPIASRRFERNKKIVLYVLLSNKYDYKAQLKVITKLLPNLWTHCKVKGFELTASFTHNESLSQEQKCLIDSPQELQAAHEEVANYTAEFARHSHAYMVPVLFLGSFLGRPYIPKRIEKDDFNLILSQATREQSELLQKFYKLDNQHSQSAGYSLATETTMKKDDIEEILVTLIKLMPINLKDSYLATAVEQEIAGALIKTKELAKRCIWIQSDYVRSVQAENPVIQTEMSRRLTNIHSQLKDEIPVKNMVRTLPSAEEQEELYLLLGAAVRASIDSVMSEHNVKYHRSRNSLGMCRQSLAEIEAVKRHSIAIGEICSNVSATEAISRYIRGDSLHPLVVFGKSGEGKSALAAEVSLKVDNWVENSHLILRFANLTELSSEITSLLASIAEQISILVSGQPSPTQHGALEYKRTIERLLETSKLFLIIIIDSVDKVIGVRDFSWLPKIPKSNTKIILTITSGEDLHDNWAANELIKSGTPKENLHMLHDHSKNMHKNEKHKNSRPSQVDVFERNPLQFKIFTKLSQLGGVSAPDNDSDKFIEKLFLALESKVDRKFLETLLVIISISTYGIYETDCVNIFQELTKLDKIYSLVIWSKFCWVVGPMLLHTDKIKIMDNTFQEAILKRYSQNVLDIQTAAKRYYEELPDCFMDLEKNQMCVNAEKYLKVPQYDLAIVAESDRDSILEQYFSRHYFRDLSWMLNKITSTGCFQLLNDILLAEGLLRTTPTTGPQHVTILKQFLTLHMAQLNCDGSQFYTLFKIFVKSSISKDTSLEQNDHVKEWTTTMDELKVTHLECLNNHNPEASADEKETYNDVVSLKGPGQYIASMNTECNEICVWDVPNCKRIRILQNVPQPSLLCSIRDFEAAVLCKREIRVIDLKEGQYKVTLKGVMNQKVPYFGLHDESHLVCLSRNRMYVNLMNLETGDCVTSFKAGEDRFLNSLIVSGNGRILVCGDESQKPFSLLVWHLSQRRLLYDLRIPHHDLFTSLSAITYEGSYVTVVAKEIRESGPNFIVVYDLQSGTLFQKLKPACNTVAIAISQANGCVIAGLENAEILIWDLVTGNCRHTLTGHNAPVTLLKVDPLGTCLLSGDKEGRDLSLRLWELSTGNALAVFSPPQKTYSCEILDNGIFIILALQNVPEVLILRLRNYDKIQMQSEEFVNESSDCKIFKLDDDEK